MKNEYALNGGDLARADLSVTMKCQTWEYVASLLPKPWDRYLMEVDLSYLDGNPTERMTKRPSLSWLAGRWGVARHVVVAVTTKYDIRLGRKQKTGRAEGSPQRRGAYRKYVMARDSIKNPDGTPSRTVPCASCGTHDDVANMDADHIVPLSHGGDDHPTNMQALCRPCHKAKTAEWAGRSK